MAKHPPAARRAVIRRLKQGEHPVELEKDARGITDPAHAAAAMVRLAGDDRLPAAKAAAIVRDATDLLETVDRPGRFAEAWGDALAVAVTLRRGPETDHAIERMQDRASAALLKLPDGQWVADAVVALAPLVGAQNLKRLAERGVRNQGWELEAARAILAADPGMEDVVRQRSPPEVVARLADAKDAVEAVWDITDMAKRRESLRVLTTKMDAPHELMALGGSSRGQPATEQAACWTMVGARLDRLGHDPSKAFDHALQAMFQVTGPDATKAHRKLAQAMERSGLEAPPAPITEQDTTDQSSSPDIPIRPLTRQAFALVDGYSGGLGAPHLRAVARAAPLCFAFDLDLVLMGFPTASVAELVDLVDAESNVGEGEGYARMLLEADRLHLIPLDHGLPATWPGVPVATTPHPAPGKEVALDDVDGPLCLLIGQGKQGLPKRLLNAVPHHHELTGKGISMETATAMGILADRLGRIPVG